MAKIEVPGVQPIQAKIGSQPFDGLKLLDGVDRDDPLRLLQFFLGKSALPSIVDALHDSIRNQLGDFLGALARKPSANRES